MVANDVSIVKSAWAWWPNKPFGFLVGPHVTYGCYISYRQGNRKSVETQNKVKNNNDSKVKYKR